MGRSPLRQQLRRSARLALYGSLIITSTLFALIFPAIQSGIELMLDQSWSAVDYGSLTEVQRFQDLLRIDTTPETGREIVAAEYLAGLLEPAGIPVTIERLPGDRANLWAIVEGRSSEALVLHSHLDTDPIHAPDRWNYPPFGGTIDVPWIFGRGAFDMKSVTIAQVEALLDLKRRIDERRQLPERSVVLLATSSEETGSHLGVQHVLARYPELVARFWAVLTEGGVLEATDLDSIKYWGTTFVQKQFVRIWACSPRRERLEDLLQDLQRRGQPGRPRIIPEALAFLRSYGHTREEVTFRRILADPELILLDEWSFDFLPPYLQALFRDEIHPFPIEENPGGGYRMRLSVHLLPGSDFASARELLLPAWLTHGVALSIEGPIGADHSSPLEHPALRSVQDTLRRRYQTEDVGPYFVTFSANDSRFFRAAGIPSYGFTPFFSMTTDTVAIAGPNERIALPGFVEGAELYRVVLRDLVWPSYEE